jgi:hypothetical protein
VLLNRERPQKVKYWIASPALSSSYRFNQPLGRIYLATAPYLVIILIVVLLITFVPAMTTGPVAWFHQDGP